MSKDIKSGVDINDGGSVPIKNLSSNWTKEDKNIPEGRKENGENFEPIKGKDSLLSSLSIIHYASFNKQGNANSSFFINSSDYFSGANATGLRNPSYSNIIESFNENEVEHAMQYKIHDFLFTDNYKKIPNNYLLTLRRFEQPCGDNLRNNLENPSRDVSRMISWMDGEENTFDSIMNMTLGYNWKEFQSEIQTLERSKTGFQGSFNTPSKIFGKNVHSSVAGKNISYSDASGMFNNSGRYAKDKLMGQQWSDFDPYNEHRDNYTWGNLDVIDKIYTRDKGLIFENDIEVKFKYRIRSYEGMNTRAVFLDVLGNILNMVSSKAPFWGGAIRFHGHGGFATPLGDFSKLKNGDTVGFLESFIGDLGNVISAPFSGGFLNGLKSIGKTLMGNTLSTVVGKGLDKLERPELYSLHSLLTSEPTGEWHLTVGNPFSPTLMIGNLAMDGATIGFEAPYTIDDVPSAITVSIKLKHCMPRDKYGVQKMFNFGGKRFHGADVDFSSKSYYRNRNGKKSGKLVTPHQTVDKAKKDSTEVISNVKSVYQTKFPAIKIL